MLKNAVTKGRREVANVGPCKTAIGVVVVGCCCCVTAVAGVAVGRCVLAAIGVVVVTLGGWRVGFSVVDPDGMISLASGRDWREVSVVGFFVDGSACVKEQSKSLVGIEQQIGRSFCLSIISHYRTGR